MYRHELGPVIKFLTMAPHDSSIVSPNQITPSTFPWFTVAFPISPDSYHLCDLNQEKVKHNCNISGLRRILQHHPRAQPVWITLALIQTVCNFKNFCVWGEQQWIIVSDTSDNCWKQNITQANTNETAPTRFRLRETTVNIVSNNSVPY